jgi:hypothetical protein
MLKRALTLAFVIAAAVACGNSPSTIDDGRNDPSDVVPEERKTRPPPPSASLPPSTPAKPPAKEETKEEIFPPAECWASNLDVGPGLCFSAHQLITSALHACFDKGGEPIAFATNDATACAGGGFRGATLKCCTASPNAKAPPETLPEPASQPTGTNCQGGSNSGTPKEDCGARAVSNDIIETVTNFAKQNKEVRSFTASSRCKDGTWSAMALKTCS